MTRSASAAQGDQRELVSSIPFTRSPSLSMSLKQQRQRLTTTGSGVNGPATTANRMSTDNSNSKTSKDGVSVHLHRYCILLVSPEDGLRTGLLPYAHAPGTAPFSCITA